MIILKKKSDFLLKKAITNGLLVSKWKAIPSSFSKIYFFPTCKELKCKSVKY